MILLLRGVLKGEASTPLAAKLGVNYQTVLKLRHDSPFPDNVTESDEMFKNAGKR